MTPAQIADALASSGHAFEDLLRSLPQHVAAWHPSEGEWCVNECAGHVIEVEKHGFAGRIRILLANDADPELPAWDRDAIARARDDCRRDGPSLADELARLRSDSVVLVRGLKPELLARAGEHPAVGTLTINDLIHEWIYHDANHLRQALANVQASVWPDMGNARRFTTD